MEEIFSVTTLVAFATLTFLEIVLGIDNIVFISILAGKLPGKEADRARLVGLGAAMITRILLLLSLTWVMSLTRPFFTVFGLEVSGRDLILLVGGIFLLAKSTHEIHERLEGDEEQGEIKQIPSFWGVILQIALLDIIFSLDSVITAIGMANHLWVMILAVVVSVVIMLFASGPIMHFVNRHPTVKMLALSFLLLIGFTLVVEAIHYHIPKGYIYFAMGFSMLVEMLNLRVRAKAKAKAEPVHLRTRYANEEIKEGM
jgi:predicted tellurium resistance membrane protein TerC